MKRIEEGKRTKYLRVVREIKSKEDVINYCNEYLSPFYKRGLYRIPFNIVYTELWFIIDQQTAELRREVEELRKELEKARLYVDDKPLCFNCGYPMTKVRPGKYQCDSPMCNGQ
jgi:hypothetical protein